MKYMTDENFRKAVEWFEYYVWNKSGGKEVDFHSGYLEEAEGFKRVIQTESHKVLKLETWHEGMVGTHAIIDHIMDALQHKIPGIQNNIVDFHVPGTLIKEVEKDLELCEGILYRLMVTDEIPEAFADFCENLGEWYPVASYLLFLRDSSNFVPVRNSNQNHKDRFQRLGIDVSCLKKASWENYKVFLDIHSEIQHKLVECFDDPEITLLDAHSFVWMFYAAPANLCNDNYVPILSKKPHKSRAAINVKYTSEATRVVEKIESEFESLPIEGEEREALVKIRANQSIFRERLFARYNGCCLCGIQNRELLIASHIKPWAKSEKSEKLDVNNGLLLCPNHDKLFDRGLISFENDGSIMVSSELSKDDTLLTNLYQQQRIKVYSENVKYLAYHREHIFKK